MIDIEFSLIADSDTLSRWAAILSLKPGKLDLELQTVSYDGAAGRQS